MRKWILGVAIFGAMVALQACAPKAQDDCGYVQNVYGERISWKGQLPIVMAIHTSVPEDDAGAIRKAADTWNQAAGRTVVQIAADRYDGTAVARDHVNVISFSSTWEQDKLSEQARTSVHWVGDQIQEADIKVNASKVGANSVFSFYWGSETPSGVNLEALILHEMGHVLGLKHKDRDSSVMATYLASNTDRTKLATTDTDSLKCEY